MISKNLIMRRIHCVMCTYTRVLYWHEYHAERWKNPLLNISTMPVKWLLYRLTTKTFSLDLCENKNENFQFFFSNTFLRSLWMHFQKKKTTTTIHIVVSITDYILMKLCKYQCMFNNLLWALLSCYCDYSYTV